MRINQIIAKATGLGRRKVDQAILDGRVKVNGDLAKLGQSVELTDIISLDDKPLQLDNPSIYLLIDKPVGYVCSRDGQGKPTIYEFIPDKYIHLKPAGRLDVDSSGLLLLTNDGTFAQSVTHPSFNKTKIYEVKLDKPLSDGAINKLENGRVILDGKPSKLILKKIPGNNAWQVTLSEGRNRQIRRTFGALGFSVIELRRIQFGSYSLNDLEGHQFKEVKN